MAEATTPHLDYHLPATEVQVRGTVTMTVDDSSVPSVTSMDAETEVNLLTRADPRFRYGIDVDAEWMKDLAFTLNLTEDLRISATSASNKGRAGAVVKGVAKFIASVVSLAGAAVTGGVGGGGFASVEDDGGDAQTGETRQTAEEVYATMRPAAAAHRQSLKTAVAEVAAALVANDRELARTIDIVAAKALAARSRLLREALGRTQSQLSEAAFGAWKATRRETTSADVDLRIAVSTLPRSVDVEKHLTDPSAEVLGGSWDAFEQLHTAVAVLDVDQRKDARDIDPNVDGTYRGVFYLKPREVELSVYERVTAPPGASAPDGLRLLRRSRHLVVDEHCERRFIKFERSAWGDRAVAVSFGPLGTPTTLTTSATSAAAAVAETASSLPGDIGAALTSAKELAGAINAMSDAGAERELTRLATRQKLLEQRIATGEAEGDPEALRELADLKRRKELLTLRKDVGSLEAALGPKPSSPPAPAAPSTGRRVVITIDGDQAEPGSE